MAVCGRNTSDSPKSIFFLIFLDGVFVVYFTWYQGGHLYRFKWSVRLLCLSLPNELACSLKFWMDKEYFFKHFIFIIMGFLVRLCVFCFLFFLPLPVGVPRPKIQPEPQQQPKPVSCQHWIPNPPSHKESPGIFKISLMKEIISVLLLWMVQ